MTYLENVFVFSIKLYFLLKLIKLLPLEIDLVGFKIKTNCNIDVPDVLDDDRNGEISKLSVVKFLCGKTTIGSS